MKKLKSTNRLIVFLICLVPLLLSGCGGGNPNVSGLVTIDGEPMLGGNAISSTIIFQPIGGGAKAVGSIDEDGYYTLYTGGKPGAAAGEYIVAVTVAEVIPAKEEGMAPTPRNITPARYGNAKTSGFKFTVAPGNNEIDLELKSS